MSAAHAAAEGKEKKARRKKWQYTWFPSRGWFVIGRGWCIGSGWGALSATCKRLRGSHVRGMSWWHHAIGSLAGRIDVVDVPLYVARFGLLDPEKSRMRGVFLSNATSPWLWPCRSLACRSLGERLVSASLALELLSLTTPSQSEKWEFNRLVAVRHSQPRKRYSGPWRGNVDKLFLSPS